MLVSCDQVGYSSIVIKQGQISRESSTGSVETDQPGLATAVPAVPSAPCPRGLLTVQGGREGAQAPT